MPAILQSTDSVWLYYDKLQSVSMDVAKLFGLGGGLISAEAWAKFFRSGSKFPSAADSLKWLNIILKLNQWLTQITIS